jgi:hypothetical protein
MNMKTKKVTPPRGVMPVTGSKNLGLIPKPPCYILGATLMKSLIT